jgi:CBS domain-containing protein
MEAVKLMVSNNIHHLIVSKNNGLIGIVSSMDILEKYVLKAKG